MHKLKQFWVPIHKNKTDYCIDTIELQKNKFKEKTTDKWIIHEWING